MASAWVQRTVAGGGSTPRSTFADVFVKGAPDRVVDMCGSWLRPDGSEAPMSRADREAALKATDSMARRGLRTIAIAQSRVRVGADGGPVEGGDEEAHAGSNGHGSGDEDDEGGVDAVARKWKQALVVAKYEEGEEGEGED